MWYGEFIDVLRHIARSMFEIFERLSLQTLCTDDANTLRCFGGLLLMASSSFAGKSSVEVEIKEVLPRYGSDVLSCSTLSGCRLSLCFWHRPTSQGRSGTLCSLYNKVLTKGSFRLRGGRAFSHSEALQPCMHTKVPRSCHAEREVRCRPSR